MKFYAMSLFPVEAEAHMKFYAMSIVLADLSFCGIRRFGKSSVTKYVWL